jgi:hypothetical protein
MFCGNCGAENANGAKFCKECGQPLVSAGASAGNRTAPPPVNQNAGAAKPAGNLKSIPQNVLIGAAAVVVLLILVIVLVNKSGSTINLDKYVTIETNGYDGYGTATVSIDWDAIEIKYGSKISFNSQASKELGGLLTYTSPVEIMRESVRVTLDPSSGLSNGDEIAYTWDVDEELSTYVKCKLKYKDGTHKVSGLTEIGTFDAFADLEIFYDGIAPEGTAEINYNGSEMSSWDFSCDKTNGLSNGDVITVSINEDSVESCAENLGMVPAELTKEYTVEGLTSYLSKIDEIDGDALESMQSQASDVYYAHVAQNWGDGEDLQSFSYLGDYLLTIKNGDSYWGNNNTLFLVYKAQVRNSYANDGDTYNKVNDIYWYISYSNLMVNSDGSVAVDVSSYNTPNDRFTIDSGVSTGWFGTQTWYYYGYQTLDELYKTVVTSNIDSYNHEDNVSESGASATVSEVSEEKDTEVETDSGYVFPDSDKKLLTQADLSGLNAEECKIARNEIYARHGRKFKDAELQAYFDALDWYEGTIDPDDFDESLLNDIEIANKNLIVAYEEDKGYR